MLAACTTSPPGWDISIFETGDITVGDTALSVYVADTATERARGLANAPSLPAGVDGMLFVFGGSSSATFTMEDTRFPLDVWWFNSSGSLVGWTQMDPCLEEPCPGYKSPGIIGWALETPAGEFEFDVGVRLSAVETG